MFSASIITAELKNVSAELNIDIILCESGYTKRAEMQRVLLFLLPSSRLVITLSVTVCSSFTSSLGVGYLMVCTSNYPNVLAFCFLDELQKEFLVTYDRKRIGGALRPYSFIEFGEFVPEVFWSEVTVRLSDEPVKVTVTLGTLKLKTPFFSPCNVCETCFPDGQKTFHFLLLTSLLLVHQTPSSRRPNSVTTAHALCPPKSTWQTCRQRSSSGRPTSCPPRTCGPSMASPSPRPPNTRA